MTEKRENVLIRSARKCANVLTECFQGDVVEAIAHTSLVYPSYTRLLCEDEELFKAVKKRVFELSGKYQIPITRIIR